MISAANVQLVRDALCYEPESGAFTWRAARGCRPAGSAAGCIGKGGRLVIRIGGVLHQAHRLAWLYMTGEWPESEIDHINGDCTDNRFGNLRDVSRGINSENVRTPRKSNRLGVLGVCKSRGRYLATLSVCGRHKHVGYFDTAEDAHAAYVKAKRQLHAGCTL